MKVSAHIIISFSAGALFWLFTKQIYAGLACFVSGVLIDIDHIIDYIIRFGYRGFTVKKLYQACENTYKKDSARRFKKLYFIFHAYEIAILLWIASIYIKNIYVLAITVGYTTHLIMDCTANPVHPQAYSIVWRAIKGFDIDKLFKGT